MIRTALVTGVSRRQGIGFALARRLLDDGHRVFAQSWSPYDATEPWGADDIESVLDLLGGEGSHLAHRAVDLADPAAPAALVDAAMERFGPLDTLVVNHARSQDATLAEIDAAMLDAVWAVNVRASLLLVQAFAAQYRPAPGRADAGRVVLFTSGTHRGPMPSEIPYAATKATLGAITATLADAVAGQGITVNCVNPGPTDTGWATPELAGFVVRHMPRGRWNSPAEAAAVVALLLSRDADSITGQVVDAEGGFRRFTP